jgi:hypothetical protein
MGLNILFNQTFMLDFMPYVVSFKWIFVSLKATNHQMVNLEFAINNWYKLWLDSFLSIYWWSLYNV